MKHGFRILTASLAIILILTAALYLSGELYRRRDYCGRFGGMHGALTRIETSEESKVDGYTVQSVDLLSDSGIEVSARLKVPVGNEKRYPALVVLGGLGTGSRVIDHLEDTSGIIVLALDYPYKGKKKDLGAAEFAVSLPRMRRAVLETVPAIILAVDYLRLLWI